MTTKMNRRDLLQLGAGALSASWTTHALATTERSPRFKHPQRIIHFPHNFGWLQLSDDFDNMVEAHGRVTIPAGVLVTLMMLHNNKDAVPLLRQLRSNDLDGLVCWFRGESVCIDHLAHLSGLRTLEITDATVEGIIDLHRFPMLDELILYRTGISEVCVAELRRDFPHIRIDYPSRSHRQLLRT